MFFRKKGSRVQFTETALRDGHQSLMATRMRTVDMLPAAEMMDQVGYDAVECWGGATFDVCMRYLNEDPWERLRQLRKKFKNTKLQMLLRGQNLVGYRHYADDVVDAFVAGAARCGIDVFRIFDALNDVRNMERAAMAARKAGAHVQLAMAYTLGEAYTMEYWIDLAKKLAELGADSICIKDMAGLLMPYEADKLVRALKKAVSVPIQLHSHCTSGAAVMSYLKAVEAGCDGIDTAISPLAMGTSQPATEVMYKTLAEGQRQGRLREDKLMEVMEYFREFRIRAEAAGTIRMDVMRLDVETLRYQIPGGMLSNLYMQMKEQNAQDRFREVLEEIPKVREELGEPPLVTPSSQIVGTQAVFNVLAGERYKMMSRQTKAMLRGEYGKTAKPFDLKLQKKAAGQNEILTCRPADRLKPELQDAAAKQIPGVKTEEDLLSYILFPQTAESFFKQREQ